MFGLFGLKRDYISLRDRWEIIDRRDLVGFFESEEEAMAFAHSWKLKGGGYAQRSILGGYEDIDVEDFSDVPHSPACK